MKKKYPEPWKNNRSRYYYFTYTDSSGKQVQKSTKETLKEKAREKVREFIDNQDFSDSTFRQYSSIFFTENCPRVKRFRSEGKPIGDTHIKKSRAWLDNHIMTDPIFPNLKLASIKRADILDLRTRLEKNISGINTLNKAIGAVKTVLSEAEFREDIGGNPGRGIGNIKFQKQTFGELHPEEIKQLLQREYWPNDIAHGIFTVASYTGMRAGEVLALRWGNIKNDHLHIIEAWKSYKKDSAGLPKWDKTRIIPLPEVLKDFLADYKSEALLINDDHLVFCWEDGSRIGNTGWRKWFYKGLTSSKVGFKVDTGAEGHTEEKYFNNRGERIKPHCLRHSLNTNLLAAGVDPLLVQMFMGWSSNQAASMTPALTRVQQGYTHLSGDLLSPVAEAIDKMYR